MAEADYILFSDGGGEKSSSAAGACIVEEVASGKRIQFVAFLGKATNNEAEISAGLIGFSFLKAIGASGSLHWVCDSEYTLKSATEYIHNWQRNGWKTASKKPVKNQGLFKSYLNLSSAFKISTEHIYGHTGHAENEACDTACTWARGEGASSITDGDEGAAIDIGGISFDLGWHLLNGEEILEALRDDNPAQDALEGYQAKIQDLGLTAFDGVGAEPVSVRTRVLNKVKRLAGEISGEDKEVAKELEDLAVRLNDE